MLIRTMAAAAAAAALAAAPIAAFAAAPAIERVSPTSEDTSQVGGEVGAAAIIIAIAAIGMAILLLTENDDPASA